MTQLPLLPPPRDYGRGLYTAEQMQEYAQQALAQPATSEKPVAWLNSCSMKAMTADEKIAWLEAGRPELVDGYNTPLFTAQPPAAMSNT